MPWDERLGEVAPPSLDRESDGYKDRIRRATAARGKFGRTWKNDYLPFCIHICAGTTQIFAATLCGIKVGQVGSIFHEWTQVVDDVLQEMFPHPSQSQMMSAYPSHFIEADAHA